MGWIILGSAILLEVCGTTCMKLSQGLTRLLPSVLLFIFYLLSLFGLTLALKKIDLSVAYAIWSGMGTALIALVGILAFKEPATLTKLLFLALIIIGVIGLKFSEV